MGWLNIQYPISNGQIQMTVGHRGVKFVKIREISGFKKGAEVGGVFVNFALFCG